MITLKKDKKSPTYIVTTTDKEGFHRQINFTEAQLNQLVEIWLQTRNPP